MTKKLSTATLVLLLAMSSLYAGKGKIRVASDHQGAYVYVDGKKKAMTGEGFSSILLEEGEYTIQVKKKSSDGEWLYRKTKKVFVGEETSTKLIFSLEKLNVNEIINFIIYETTCSSDKASNCTATGYMYLNGKGVEKDRIQAIKFYKFGCDYGHADGCTNLGYMYDKGEGVNKNRKQAIKFYKQGCNAGSEQGCSNYKILNKNTFSTKCTNYKVVTVHQLNIRNKPKKPSNIVGKVNKGDTVCIYRFVGKWGKSDKGWISGKYLE